jgi:hypothetical protein
VTWTALENAVHGVLVTASGLGGSSVCLGWHPGPAPTTSPFLRLELGGPVLTGSVDKVTDAPAPVVPGAEVLSTTWVRVSVPLRVHAFSAVPSGAASLAAQLVAEMQHPDFVEACGLVDIALTDVTSQHLPAWFETAYQDRAVVECTLWAWLDRTHARTFIEHVYGEATYASPGHAPTTLPFGPVP